MIYWSCISAVFIPLVGALIAGLFRKQIGKIGATGVTILGVGISFALSAFIFNLIVIDQLPAININLFTWATVLIGKGYQFHIGFLIDQLTAVMMVTVTFVSLLVHIYSIGYMADDDGYQRFFSYISLFTFMMLMLVTSNNLLQLFFGWEGVGLVSYLLISFWFERDSATAGGLKAFLVNRVGDFGFILGIAAVLAFTGTLDYQEIFAQAPALANKTYEVFKGYPWSLPTVICLLLFVGAMGKSAQVPLHVWLPESMEGPTPISALIHAATMVTAGVFMVSRMSPLFELSNTALSVVMIIGATGALFLGLIAIVQNDIKRVVAYSTLSQLGYMVAALGASAYSASMFHLVTHAAFKALLFLGAGSVIIAMHHEQDIRKMGGLRKYMPITYITFLLGTLSLSAIPPFAGFYSKDVIIEAIGESVIPGSGYAYVCLMLGAFVTALYSFRVFFLTFHTQERMDHHTKEHLHESPWTILLPLVVLAVPSVVLGAILIDPMLFSLNPLLDGSITVSAHHDALKLVAEEFHGWFAMMLHAIFTLPFWLSIAGILTAWICYIVVPTLPAIIESRLQWFYDVLLNKYGFDDFNQFVLVRGARALAQFFSGVGDRWLIDGLLVNGLAMQVRNIAAKVRLIQTGYLYHYAFVMVFGLLVFLTWLILG